MIAHAGVTSYANSQKLKFENLGEANLLGEKCYIELRKCVDASREEKDDNVSHWPADSEHHLYAEG